MDTWVIGKNASEEVLQYFGDIAPPVTFFCFDYFDTLIVREIEPEHTKRFAADLLSRLLRSEISADLLYDLRRDLEKTMCEESLAAGGELEFYLSPFAARYYDILSEQYSEIIADCSKNNFITHVLDIELAVELAVQRPCPETIQVLRELKKKNLATVLVSDFYLPQSHFEKMLKHFQLFELFDHVYVSSDHCLAKGSGRLYEKILTDLNCEPQQLLMIGDNPHSDVVKAREKGLHTLHLQNPQQRDYYSRWKPEIHRKSEKVEQRFADCLRASGPFKEMAYSLWYFTFLLFQNLVKEGVRDVFFFSKEGEFLKKLFDCFQQDLYGDGSIQSHYLLVSRKATFLASLRPLEHEDFARLFAHYRDISLRDFLLSLNLEESTAADICTALGLDFEIRRDNLPEHEDFTTLRQSDVFEEIYEERRKQQHHNFLSYLDSFATDYHENGLTIVDVGWKGSIQDNIYHILRGKVRVRGMYIGSLIATERKRNNLKTGLLFDDTPVPSPYFHAYNNNRSLFEMMLGASHGSADGYFTREQYAKLPSDHKRTISRTIKVEEDEICVSTLDLPEERALYNKEIQPLQEKMYASMTALNRAYIASGCITPGEEWFARQHARMVFTPTQEEVDFFERLYHLENFGIFEYTNFQAGEKISLLQRLKNLQNVIRSKDLLESGVWPPIILRRLGVGYYRHVDGRRRFQRVFGKR